MTLKHDRRIVDLAAKNDGIVTWHGLRQQGLSDKAIRNRIDGVLQQLARGVYLVGAPTNRAYLRAALSATPAAVVADLSAAKLHGLGTRAPQTPAVVAPHGTKQRGLIEAVNHRQTRWLPAEDHVVVEGFACTSIERTVCDLASILFRREFRRLVEWTITERKMTVNSFQACVHGYARQGRAGSTLVRQASIDLLSNEPIVGSVLEQQAIKLFRSARLPAFEVQFEPPWSDGTDGIVDVAWPQHRLIVELDGRRWHSFSTAIANDRSRDRRAAAAGWSVLRFGWQEVTERPALVVREIRELLTDPAAIVPTSPFAA